MNVRIATWNVNSIRSRIDRVEAWLERSDADVLAIQETKANESQFPMLGLNALGYEVAHIGLNQWNGVAILSRVGLTDVEVGFPDMPPFGDPPAAEARAIAATCGGVRIWSLYVPNGRALGDPHLTYKLDWLERLRLAASGWLRADPGAQHVLVILGHASGRQPVPPSSSPPQRSRQHPRLSPRTWRVPGNHRYGVQ